MKQIRETYKKTGSFHHAYGLLGNRKSIKEDLFSFLNKDLKFPTASNTDFWQGEFNVFKIADSRAINEAHLNKPIKYDKKVFAIFANSITKDAQNALLKIFEEPRSDSIFFLVLPRAIELLPTLKSRMIISTEEDNSRERESILSAEEFLEAKTGKRLAVVAKIVKDIKDEKITKTDAIDFIKDLEKVFKKKYKMGNNTGSRNKNILAVEDLEKAISYASDESPSIRVILEHLALVL